MVHSTEYKAPCMLMWLSVSVDKQEEQLGEKITLFIMTVCVYVTIQRRILAPPRGKRLSDDN